MPSSTVSTWESTRWPGRATSHNPGEGVGGRGNPPPPAGQPAARPDARGPAGAGRPARQGRRSRPEGLALTGRPEPRRRRGPVPPQSPRRRQGRNGACHGRHGACHGRHGLRHGRHGLARSGMVIAWSRCRSNPGPTCRGGDDSTHGASVLLATFGAREGILPATRPRRGRSTGIHPRRCGTRAAGGDADRAAG